MLTNITYYCHTNINNHFSSENENIYTVSSAIFSSNMFFDEFSFICFVVLYIGTNYKMGYLQLNVRFSINVM